MDNYNPRQNTRMRWKDAREIEKFKFFTENYDFEEQELLEDASQDERYGTIVEAFKESIRTNKNIGVILQDGPTAQYTYIGYIAKDVGYLYTISTTSILIVNLEYDNQRDTLSITNTTEDILVADNVKTLFGNQSIIGQGNIDLYVHHLLINSNCYFTIYSSNNLKVDTPEKLTTLLKDKNTSIYYFGYQQTQYISTAAISFNAATNLWQIRVSGEETSSEITDVADIVTTI